MKITINGAVGYSSEIVRTEDDGSRTHTTTIDLTDAQAQQFRDQDPLYRAMKHTIAEVTEALRDRPGVMLATIAASTVADLTKETRRANGLEREIAQLGRIVDHTAGSLHQHLRGMAEELRVLRSEKALAGMIQPRIAPLGALSFTQDEVNLSFDKVTITGGRRAPVDNRPRLYPTVPSRPVFKVGDTVISSLPGKCDLVWTVEAHWAQRATYTLVRFNEQHEAVHAEIYEEYLRSAPPNTNKHASPPVEVGDMVDIVAFSPPIRGKVTKVTLTGMIEVTTDYGQRRDTYPECVVKVPVRSRKPLFALGDMVDIGVGIGLGLVTDVDQIRIRGMITGQDGDCWLVETKVGERKSYPASNLCAVNEGSLALSAFKIGELVNWRINAQAGWIPERGEITNHKGSSFVVRHPDGTDHWYANTQLRAAIPRGGDMVDAQNNGRGRVMEISSGSARVEFTIDKSYWVSLNKCRLADRHPHHAPESIPKTGAYVNVTQHGRRDRAVVTQAIGRSLAVHGATFHRWVDVSMTTKPPKIIPDVGVGTRVLVHGQDGSTLSGTCAGMTAVSLPPTEYVYTVQIDGEDGRRVVDAERIAKA